jgi:hypothetical protein
MQQPHTAERGQVVNSTMRAAAIATMLLAGAIACGGGSRSSEPPAAPAGPSIRSQVIDWRSNGGNRIFADFQRDTGAFFTAAKRTDFGALGTACGSLENDVAEGRAYSSIPDAPADRAWREALTHLGEAARACVASARSGRSAGIAAATQEIGNSNSALAILLDRFRTLGAT